MEGEVEELRSDKEAGLTANVQAVEEETKTRSPISSWQVWCLPRPLRWACTWPPSLCVLMVFPLCVHIPHVSSSSYKDMSPIGLGPHPYDCRVSPEN